MKALRYSLIILAILVFLLLPNVSYLYTEYLWYKDLGFERVFYYRTFGSIVLFLLALAVSSLVIYAGIYPVIKESDVSVAIPLTRIEKFLFIVRSNIKKYYKPVSLALGAVVAISFSFQLSQKWEELLLFFYGADYGLKVPVYNLDVSFFLFRLPVFSFLLSWLASLVFSSLLIVLIVYFVKSLTYTWSTFVQVFYWYRKHVFMLLGFFTLILAGNIYSKSFFLAYSKRGVIFGPGYVDVHYLIPFYRISAVVCALFSLVFFLTAFRLVKVRHAGYAVVLAITAYFLGTTLVPSMIQAYVVSPNELKLESEYISNNIRFTREAYGLDIYKEKEVDFENSTMKDDVSVDNPAVSNARLWDNRPLYEVFNQVQTIRSYYIFSDIDIDRYELNGSKVQVALSVRELDTENLADRAKTWVNLHLKYTHGYGAVVSSVTEKTQEGLPVFYLKDLPPKSSAEVFKLKQPQIYFGEKTDNYIIVKTKEEEFGYPSGDKNVYEKWQGKNGIKLDSYFKRLAFAMRFGAFKILLSKEITNESVMLFDRNIQKRLKKIAPFFKFDDDPYPVIANQKIFWICDGYTVSERFPYSEPFENRFNYIRNSVKAVVDAYSGEVSFYIFDEKDPIVAAYARIFPELFKTKEEMNSELKKHVRYPADLFWVQAQMLSNYHMLDPQVFYNKEDRWDVAEELYEDDKIFVEPYYVMIPFDIRSRNSEPEFILILPMTPSRKNNLVSWIFVASDGDNYGRGGIYKFPKGKLVYGPLQVEARINQNPEISKELTLWSQAGSRVIRGNLLVIPLKSGILYLEPLYLKSEEGSIPELKRVIVADLEKVVMAEDLSKALSYLKGEEEVAEGRESSKTVSNLDEIRQIVRLMNEKLKTGDLRGFADLFIRLKLKLGVENGDTTSTE